MNLSASNTGIIFESLFISFAVCILTALAATKFALRIKLLDYPNAEPHKRHDRPVPISGGIALFSELLILLLIFHQRLSKDFLGLSGAALILFCFALWDDIKVLNWKIKLAGQIIAASVLIISGTQTHLFDAQIFTPLSPWLRRVGDVFLTMFWVVFITNAFNLVDSADGLMLGIASWAEGFFIIAALDAGQGSLALYTSFLLGGTLALSFFNSYPAFLFMGDSGAQVIGFLLSAIAIMYNPAELLQKNTWFLPIMMLGVPIFDTTLVTISRWRRGEHFYHSGTDHTFHRLLKMGLSSHQASGFMHLACFALQSLSFLAISQSAVEANLIFAVVVLAGIFGIVFFEREDWWEKLKRIVNISGN